MLWMTRVLQSGVDDGVLCYRQRYMGIIVLRDINEGGTFIYKFIKNIVNLLCNQRLCSEDHVSVEYCL